MLSGGVAEGRPSVTTQLRWRWIRGSVSRRMSASSEPRDRIAIRRATSSRTQPGPPHDGPLSRQLAPAPWAIRGRGVPRRCHTRHRGASKGRRGASRGLARSRGASRGVGPREPSRGVVGGSRGIVTGPRKSLRRLRGVVVGSSWGFEGHRKASRGVAGPRETSKGVARASRSLAMPRGASRDMGLRRRRPMAPHGAPTLAAAPTQTLPRPLQSPAPLRTQLRGSAALGASRSRFHIATPLAVRLLIQGRCDPFQASQRAARCSLLA